MRGKWPAIGAMAVVLGAGAGALSVRLRRPALPAAKPATAAIERDFVSSGIVRPRHLVPVAPAAAGPVDVLPVEAGQDVYQGEVLARVGASVLESARDAASQGLQQAQAEAAQAEARVVAARLESSRAGAEGERAQMDLERSRKVYERQRVLHDAGATPRLVYEKAEQDYQTSQQANTAAQKAVSAAEAEAEAGNAALATARKELADRTAAAESAQLALAAADVRSPVDGVLFAIHAEVGKNWDGHGPMFEIATRTEGVPEALEVAVEAPPEVLQRIRPGQEAMVTVGGANGGETGAVREILGSQAIVEFQSTLPALKPGAQASVRLKVE